MFLLGPIAIWLVLTAVALFTVWVLPWMFLFILLIPFGFACRLYDSWKINRRYGKKVVSWF